MPCQGLLDFAAVASAVCKLILPQHSHCNADDAALDLVSTGLVVVLKRSSGYLGQGSWHTADRDAHTAAGYTCRNSRLQMATNQCGE